jgi:hypothetical protein
VSIDGVKKVNEYIIKDGRTLILTQFIDDPTYVPAGSIYISPFSGDLQFLKLDNESGGKDWTHFDFKNFFEYGSFDERFIKDNDLNGEKITDLSLTANKLVDKTITSDKLADESITTLQIKEIDGSKLVDGSLTTNKFLDESIINSLLVNKTITNEKIEDGTIISELIADNSILNTHLTENCIDTKNIKELAINHKLIADNSIDSNNIIENCITEKHIQNGSITTDKIADDSITKDKIPNFSITDILINDVDGSKINDNSVVGKKLKDNTIENSKIKDDTIDLSKLNYNLRTKIDNSLKLEAAVNYDDKKYLNTVLVEGNMLLIDKNSKCTLSVEGDINSTGDITGARVFNPYFADIAEGYIPDEYLSPGDPVCLCEEGNLKVEKLNDSNYERFLGFVSDEYATLFGATKEEIKRNKKIPITLIGRIKAKIGLGHEGYIGNYISILSNGTIGITKEKTINSIGRLLENKTKEQMYVLCQLWP